MKIITDSSSEIFKENFIPILYFLKSGSNFFCGFDNDNGNTETIWISDKSLNPIDQMTWATSHLADAVCMAKILIELNIDSVELFCKKYGSNDDILIRTFK